MRVITDGNSVKNKPYDKVLGAAQPTGLELSNVRMPTFIVYLKL